MTRIPKSIKSTQQILNGSNHLLQSLVSQSKDLVSIEAIVSRFVTDPFSVASYSNQTLTLVTSSSAIATRIRYRQRNIMASLKRTGLPVDTLHIKVRPDLTKSPVEPAEPRFLSASSARQIAQTAKYIEDEPLRKALIRLSKRSSQTST